MEENNEKLNFEVSFDSGVLVISGTDSKEVFENINDLDDILVCIEGFIIDSYPCYDYDDYLALEEDDNEVIF